jgi:hypothetical protein
MAIDSSEIGGLFVGLAISMSNFKGCFAFGGSASGNE